MVPTYRGRSRSSSRTCEDDALLTRAPGWSASGCIIEQLADGTTSTWGTVIEWEPPHRVRFTWHPGAPTAEATEVEVRFSGQGTGTIVELIHRGWERRSDGADARSRYDSGWEPVFRRYLDRATAASTSEHRAG